ncbi:MAG: membrane protein insertase YidC, partial [Gammaproteobacteria bacterium]|nr:membrane protein insertase YidC [Gammaproteobacteria bacterium]
MFLWLGLVLALWINYETWQRDYAVPAPVTPATTSSAPLANVPTASIPQGAAPAASAKSTATTTLAAAPATAAGAAAGTVRVTTDVLDLELSLRGGDLVRADLLKYPRVKGGEERVRLLNDDASHFYFLQTGLTDTNGAAHPTHLALFESAQTRHALAEGAAELRVPLTWVDAATGVSVTKTYILRRGSYRIDLEYAIENRGTAPWRAASYAQILRNDKPVERSMFSVESYAFQGPAYYNGTKYFKINRQKIADSELPRSVTTGWIAGMQHHFVTVVVPAEGQNYAYSLKTQDNQYLLSATGPMVTVGPQSGTTLRETLFIGPKLQAQLKTAGPRLDLVADYGVLTLLAEPLFWLLEQAHNIVGNWGWAIVIITFLLKLMFYPLSESSGRSMAKMKVLAPRMKNLQETYKDDREKLGRAMMDLYKREKINPAAGCLPILIQMPVFFAFYWVLLESVEMRQAPFMLWIQDLSSRDPFFVLPVIMAGAMFVQYKLNPTPPDPIQAKVFMILPFVMSFTFAFFPAGLVLYWVTNTLLTILQQWNINRRIEAE